MNEIAFWKKMNKHDNGCWEWTGAITGGDYGGYGNLHFFGKVMYAHRVAWILCFGPIPEKMNVSHICNNKKCCNPEHLILSEVYISEGVSEDTFWNKLAKKENGCWEWVGSTTGGKCGGYGILHFHEKVMYAHRVAWILSFGTIPEKKEVAHKCDNRKCCRPDHLFLASHLENMRDMVSKGRHKPGGKPSSINL